MQQPAGQNAGYYPPLYPGQYPPPPQGYAPQPPPGQPMYYPPSQQQPHGYPPAPLPVAYHPSSSYDDDRDRGRNRRRTRSRSRSRSRSPSVDRSRRHGDSNRGESSRGTIGTFEKLPPLKPGEVAYSLLVPAFGLSTLTPKFKDISSATSTTITLLDDTQSASSTRRSIRFIGKWSNCLVAQRQVLDCLQISTSNDFGSLEETLVLIPRDSAQNLTQSLSDIENSTNTTIKVFPSRGGMDAQSALVVVTSRLPDGSTPEEKKKSETDAVSRIKECLGLKTLLSELPDESETWARISIPVASRFAGSVIGKNAAIVRELQSETNARINLSREGTKVETPTETLRFVTAEGTGAQVRAAYTKIMEHLNDAKKRAREELKDGSMLKVPLSVPDHLIGVIIGKKGKVLKDLQDDTGTKIHIEHSGKDDRTPASARLVEISGDPAKVEHAQRIIVERLIEAVADQQNSYSSSTSSRHRERSRSPSEHRDRDRSTYSSSSYSTSNSSRAPPSLITASSASSSASGEPVDKMTISVPVQQVGAVIGTRGATVRQICEDSGARVHIEGKDEIAPDAKERVVTITGTTSQVTHAFDLIQKALAESNEARTKNGGGGNSNQPQFHIVSSTLPSMNQRRDYPGYPPHGQAPPPPSQHYQQVGAPPGFGQGPPPPYGYGQPMPPQQQHQHAPPPRGGPQQYYYGNYPPPSGAPVPLPSLPPPSSHQGYGQPPQQHQGPPPSQQQQQQQGGGPPSSSFFDPQKLSILSQLAKTLPTIGSGNITQITGSPPNPQPPSGYPYRQ